jgi:hypothetical protein
MFPAIPLDANGFIQYTFEAAEGLLGVCLDTNEPGKPWRSFCEKRGAGLRQTLDKAGVMIFMRTRPATGRQPPH